MYNGGLTTGITALILLPILEHYQPHTRQEIKSQAKNLHTMISLVDDLSLEVRNAHKEISFGSAAEETEED